jgi:hypothetical protein
VRVRRRRWHPAAWTSARPPFALERLSVIRGPSARSSRTWANHSNRRQCRRLVARPPTGANSCKSMTTGQSFRRRPTSCLQSTSTASDRCRTPGQDKAAGLPDSERLRGDVRKTPLQRGKACGKGTGCGVRETVLRKCHWPGYPPCSNRLQKIGPRRSFLPAGKVCVARRWSPTFQGPRVPIGITATPSGRT